VAPRAIVSLIDEIELPAQETGVISELLVKEGAIVKQGAILVRIDDQQARLQLRETELEAEIATAKANDKSAIVLADESLRIAQGAHERAKDTIRRFPDSLSITELEQYALRVAEAQAAVEQSRVQLTTAQLSAQLALAQVASAKAMLERRLCRASIEGMVLEVKRQPGEWVAPGESIVRLVRLDRLKCEGFVKETEDPSRLLGAKVELSVETSPGKITKFAGEIAFVSPEIEPVSREILVYANIDNSGLKLRPGVTGEMRIFPKR